MIKFRFKFLNQDLFLQYTQMCLTKNYFTKKTFSNDEEFMFNFQKIFKILGHRKKLVILLFWQKKINGQVGTYFIKSYLYLMTRWISSMGSQYNFETH